ncbi:MAG: type III-A CRISPR-associated protein Csm2 [Lachnospiraceae bacterium]
MIPDNYKNYENVNQKNKKNYVQPALPEGYLEGGYYSDPEKEKLKKEYITRYPENIAKSLEHDSSKEVNKRSQIRKFYEYLLRVERKMQLKGNDYSMAEADLEALVPYVSYANKRKLVSALFQTYIKKNVESVHDEKDMKAFVKHFEALVAFTKRD